MIERFTAHFGSLDHNEELFLDLRLTMKVIEVRRAQGEIKGGVNFSQDRIHRSVAL